MRCPKCDSSIEDNSVMCRYCRSRLVEPPPSAAAAAPKGYEAPVPLRQREEPSAPRPWEVWIVIGLTALNLITNISQGNLGGMIAGVLIISGLFKQSTGTWWFVTIVNTIAAIFCFAMMSRLGTLMLAQAVGCLVVVGLMISARMRGAYAFPVD